MKHVLTEDKIMSPKDLKRLLSTSREAMDGALALNRKKAWTLINDYFLFSVCANCGLRVSELVSLKWRDILDSSLVVRAGKGNKKRTVHFGAKTKKLFLEFRRVQKDIMKRACLPEHHLFIGQRGPLTRHGAHYRFKMWLQKAGLNNQSLGFHSLRHSYATRCLDGGIDLNTLKEQLGHASLSTSSVYLHLTQKAKDDVARLF